MHIKETYTTPPHYRIYLLGDNDGLPEFGDVIPDLDSVVTGLGKVIKGTGDVIKIGKILPDEDVVPDLDDVLEERPMLNITTNSNYIKMYA